MSQVKEPQGKEAVNPGKVEPKELVDLLSPLPGQRANRGFIDDARAKSAPPPFAPPSAPDPLASNGIRVPSSITPEVKKLLGELLFSGKATKEDIERLLKEALDPGLRIQGTEFATCGYAQLVRRLSVNEFLKAASELALNGRTALKGGEIEASEPLDPKTGMPYSGMATGKAAPYGSPSRLLNLLTCSISYAAMGSKEGETQGAFARQLENGFEIASGSQHTVAYGAVGSVLFYARARQGLQTTGSFRFAKDGELHANHALTTQDINGGRVVYANTWGSPKDTDPRLAGVQVHNSFGNEGPDGRKIVQGGESGREALGLKELAGRTNFVIVDGAIDKIEITDEMARDLFGESKEQTISRLEKIIAAQNAEGITNTELVKEGDRVFLRLKINDANFDDSGYPDPTVVAECAGKADLILDDVLIKVEQNAANGTTVVDTSKNKEVSTEESALPTGGGKILRGPVKFAQGKAQEEARLPLPKKRFDTKREDEASNTAFSDDRWKPNSSRDPNASPDSLYVSLGGKDKSLASTAPKAA